MKALSTLTRRSVLALSAVAGLLAGCAGTVLDPITPKVEFVGFSFDALGVGAQTGQVELRVTNPNRFELSGENLQVELDIDGRDFAQVASTERVVLPAGAATIVRLRTRADLASVAALAPTLLRGGEAAYQLDGSYAPDILKGRTTPISKSGTLRVEREGASFRLRTGD